MTIDMEPERKGNGKLIFLGLLIAVVMAACYLAYQGNFLSSINKPATVSEKEFTKKPDSKNTGEKVFVLTNETFTQDTNVKLRGVQFKQEQSRIWLNLVNNGNKDLQVMSPLAEAVLVDDKGKQYKVDPLATRNPSSIAPKANADIELVFPPIPADTKTITIKMARFFRLGEPGWDMTLEFNSP